MCLSTITAKYDPPKPDEVEVFKWFEMHPRQEFIELKDGNWKNVELVEDLDWPQNSISTKVKGITDIWFTDPHTGQINGATMEVIQTVNTTDPATGAVTVTNIPKKVATPYSSGFHCLKTQEDADKYRRWGRQGWVLLKVKVRNVVAEGIQEDANCIVARDIFIPKDAYNTAMIEQFEKLRTKYGY